jgi:hypothetical protein
MIPAARRRIANVQPLHPLKPRNLHLAYTICITAGPSGSIPIAAPWLLPVRMSTRKVVPPKCGERHELAHPRFCPRPLPVRS